ncbi:maleylpyruvate isomerase N-terminal domain-containing protein [Nocardia alni]|uniref:maleylpyruvate isomerase N-terminal domain-containing protein n=1 Tax=Nocardia alni TaxID=2815723 RepID=UPI0020B2D368|nr:maleylpyruvate isomerase N-terminal domain-containing protein [Nocardia alni]
MSVMEFFANAESFQADLDAQINTMIRDNGEKAASDGPKSLVATVESAIAHQRDALSAEPADRVVSFIEKPMRIDDFLLTRMLELVVHSDDLALSVGLPTPAFPPHVFEPVLDVLSRLAVARHGQLAVLRALSRAERAPATIAGI